MDSKKKSINDGIEIPWDKDPIRAGKVGKKLSASLRGRTLSEKHKRAIAENVLGRIWVHKETQIKQIYPIELDLYLTNGWIKGAPKGKIWVHNETQTSRIFNKELETYLSNGWILGRGNRAWISNGIQSKQISKDELNTYLSQGWAKGRKIKH